MRFGELAWLAHRGCCTQGCAQRERVRHQVAKSSRERQMAGYAREELSFAAHAACGNAERRHRLGLHHTRAAAAVRCFTQERRALAIAITRAWVQEGGPKFAQVCSWQNVPHFGQRAISSQRWSERCGANRPKTIPTQTAQQTIACNCPSAIKAKARQEAVTNQVWILGKLTQFSSGSL